MIKEIGSTVFIPKRGITVRVIRSEECGDCALHGTSCTRSTEELDNIVGKCAGWGRSDRMGVSFQKVSDDIQPSIKSIFVNVPRI